MKKCVICKEEKPPEEFNKNKSKPDGLQLHCKPCSKAKSNKYYCVNKRKYIDASEDRKEILALFLLEKLKPGCVSCSEKDPVVLDFDHLSDKKHGIAYMLNAGYSIKNIELEIAKCQILCANCHRRKTAKEQGWRFKVPST